MPGFFSLMKAINKSTDELLSVGKDYAIRFKSGEIDARDYENDMVGKIYEIANKYSNGDEEMEKYLRNQFADNAVKYLKEGINAYEESMQGAAKVEKEISPEEESDDFENEEAPSQLDEKEDEKIMSNKKAAVSSNIKSDKFKSDEDMLHELFKLM